jgi:hypothetical protein
MSNTSVTPTLTISPAAIFTGMRLVIALLIVMHAVVQIAEFGFGRDHMMGLMPLFDMDREHNLPAWYSGSVLLLTALSLGAVAAGTYQSRMPFAGHWLMLALLFLYLSFDELTAVHEGWAVALNRSFGELRDRSVLFGALRHLWVLPALLFVALVGLASLRFLAHLPRQTRRLFILSGALFVIAAVGFEMLGAAFTAAIGRRSGGFEILVAAEEGLEMFSIALFLNTVLLHISQTFSAILVAAPHEFRDTRGAVVHQAAARSAVT